VLAQAESNQASEGDGRAVWTRHVEPARVDAKRVVAHLGLVDLLGAGDPGDAGDRVACWQIAEFRRRRVRRGRMSVSAGVVGLVHLRTGRTERHAYAAVHLGGLDVHGAVRPAADGRDDADVAVVCSALDEGRPLTTILRELTDRFGPDEFGLDRALPDAAEQIVAGTAAMLEDRFVQAFDQLYESAGDELAGLATAGFTLPRAIRVPAELAIGRRLEAEIVAQGGSWDPRAYEEAVRLVQEASAHGLRIDAPRARRALQQTVTTATARAVRGHPGAVDSALALLDLAGALDIALDLARPQEAVYDALVGGAGGSLRRLGEALGLAVDDLGMPSSTS
jgi:Domain of unknown function (DUF3536)